MKTDSEYFEYLKTKETISLPALQKDFSCSYTDAKQAMSLFRQKHWVSESAEGILYNLNRGTLFRRDLSDEECDGYLVQITTKEVNVIKTLIETENEDGALSPAFLRRNSNAMKRLISCGLVHEFEGAYFLSVTEESAQKIVSDYCENPYNIVLVYIAYPILDSAIEDETGLDELLKLPFIPKICKRYITIELKRYKLTGVRPDRNTEQEKMPDVKTLKYDIIESLVLQCDFHTKAQYDKKALQCVETIAESKLCSEEFKKAAKEAYYEITNSLTFGNLREIRKIIMDNSDDIY